MPAAAARLLAERLFHDRQAESRAGTFAKQPHLLQFTDADYLDHETWLQPAFARLGDLRGQDALDFGCGHGMAAVVMARAGARVTAFDLSAGYVREAQCRAAANEVRVKALQADGQHLPFPDHSFDRLWGHAILHHLDLKRTSCELARVLRPDGVAVFCEPWGENALLNWARGRLAYSGKERTADEQPLRLPDLDCFHRAFGVVEIQGHQLFSMAGRVLPWKSVVALLGRWDRVLLSRLPVLQTYCRYVVLTLRRPLL